MLKIPPPCTAPSPWSCLLSPLSVHLSLSVCALLFFLFISPQHRLPLSLSPWMTKGIFPQISPFLTIVVFLFLPPLSVFCLRVWLQLRSLWLRPLVSVSGVVFLALSLPISQSDLGRKTELEIVADFSQSLLDLSVGEKRIQYQNYWKKQRIYHDSLVNALF